MLILNKSINRISTPITATDTDSDQSESSHFCPRWSFSLQVQIAECLQSEGVCLRLLQQDDMKEQTSSGMTQLSLLKNTPSRSQRGCWEFLRSEGCHVWLQVMDGWNQPRLRGFCVPECGRREEFSSTVGLFIVFKSICSEMFLQKWNEKYFRCNFFPLYCVENCWT